MSVKYDALLLDIGNTQIKGALVNTQDIAFNIQTLAHNSTQLITLVSQAHKVILASVAKQTVADNIHLLAQDAGVACQQVMTSAEAFNVTCAYENYETLGVDRWLAILGADQISDKPCAILDMGTAATVDVLDNKQHQGGWIVPGYNLMRDSLTRNTAQVFSDEAFPENAGLGTSTPECVKQGCLTMLYGLVGQTLQHMSKHYAEFDVFLCGGSAELIDLTSFNQDKEQIKRQDALVFVGLKRFI